MIAFRLSRTLVRLLLVGVVVGCGGQVTDSFSHSVYVEITNAGGLSPNSAALPNTYRIVFLNNDAVAHTVNWNSPLVLSATAQPGNRAWFELPQFFTGTILTYHLDTNGPSGSVTIVMVPSAH
jgi:hypothetical protein